MKRSVIALLLIVCLTAATLMPAAAVSLDIDNVTAIENVYIYNNTSYVPLRAVTNIISPDAVVVVGKTARPLFAKPT